MSTPGSPTPNLPPQPNVWQAPTVPTPGYNPSGIPANRLYGGVAPAPTPAPVPAQPNLWRPAPAPANPGNVNQNPNQPQSPLVVPFGAVAHYTQHPANHGGGHGHGGHERHSLLRSNTARRIGTVAVVAATTVLATKLGWEPHHSKHNAEVFYGTAMLSTLAATIGRFTLRQVRHERHERRINNNQTDMDHAAIQAANRQALIVRANNVIGAPVGYYDPTSFKYVDETTNAEPPSPFANPFLTQKPGFNPRQFAASLRKNGPLRVKRRDRTH